jgi:hypothetical protein
LTERKQIKVKVSPGRPSLTKSIYKNKWQFTYHIVWTLNKKALEAHYAKIMKNGVCIQSMVKGLSDLHEQVNKLLEVPRTAYGNLHGTWWQFKET